MIILLHGENTLASREELIRVRESNRDKEIIVMNGRGVDLAVLTQAVSAPSLFEPSRIVIIEQLLMPFSKTKKIPHAIADIFTNPAKGTDVYLWEDGEVGKTLLSALGQNIQIKLFKLPNSIFAFLDALHPDNIRTILGLYNTALGENVPEVIFVMITKRLRQLIMVKDHAEPAGLASWQLSRLTNQAKYFTMEQLIGMYDELVKLDFTYKSGLSPLPFPHLLRQFLLQLN